MISENRESSWSSSVPPSGMPTPAAVDSYFADSYFQRSSRNLDESTGHVSCETVRLKVMEIHRQRGFIRARDVGIDLIETGVITPNKGADLIRWIDIQGDARIILRQLQNIYSFDAHAIDNCQQYDDRPRFEDYGDHLFIVSHLLDIPEAKSTPYQAPELHTFLAPGLIVTIHSEPFEPISRVWFETKTKCALEAEQGADLLYCRVVEKLLQHNEEQIDRI